MDDCNDDRPAPDLDLTMLDLAMLDALAPLHLRLDAEGRILGLGRGLQKLLGARAAVGGALRDHFEIDGADRLSDLLGSEIAARPRSATAARLSGAVLCGAVLCGPSLPGGAEQLIILFALDSDLPEAARRAGLTAADLAPAGAAVLRASTLAAERAAQTRRLAAANSRIVALAKTREDALLQAKTDALTGLPNRAALLERTGDGAPYHAALQIDIDHFKAINDRFGHEAGDKALIAVAASLRAALRPGDFIARTGGDEFVAVLYDPIDVAGADAIAADLIERVSAPRDGAQGPRLGLSIGVRMVEPGERRCFSRLIADADLALYTAKNGGRGRCVFFTGAFRDAIEQEAEMIDIIRQGLREDAFRPFFQPQVSVMCGSLMCVEALARLEHPSKGMLTPDAFLEPAKSAGLLGEIDAQIRGKAFRIFADWRNAGLAPPQLALNVAAEVLTAPDYIDTICHELDCVDLFPQDIALEILENAVVGQRNAALEAAIHALAERGFAIHLDDFGGLADCVASLVSLPITKVKLDRSVISGVDQNPLAKRTARSVIDLSTHLGAIPLAERVETDSERAALADIGCAEIQGFCLAAPMPAAAFGDWLTEAGRLDDAASG